MVSTHDCIGLISVRFLLNMIHLLILFLAQYIPFRYFGTATQVKRKGRSKRGQPDTYSVDIRFDDGSTANVEYPSSDVQILTVEGDEAHVEMQGGERVLAYEGSLSNLAIGDLVDSRYQAGSENGAWFRGRVASVNAEAGTCDVVYYDKEVRARAIRKDAFSLCLLRANYTIFNHTSMNKTFQCYEPICADSKEDEQTLLGLRA